MWALHVPEEDKKRSSLDLKQYFFWLNRTVNLHSITQDPCSVLKLAEYLLLPPFFTKKIPIPFLLLCSSKNSAETFGMAKPKQMYFADEFSRLLTILAHRNICHINLSRPQISFLTPFSCRKKQALPYMNRPGSVVLLRFCTCS